MSPTPTVLLWAILGAASCLVACGSSSHSATVLAAADAKGRQRRPEEAARLYQEAASTAKDPDLAAEARYRECSMWKRHDHPDRALACLEGLAEEHASSSRGPRIWLDLGRAREARGDTAGARAAYRRVLRYGDGALGSRAADALVLLSPGPRSDAYRTLQKESVGSPDLDAFLRLRLARAEVDEGRPAAALATCEALAKAYPLPRGVYTDDALLLAANLRRTLGDAEGALVTISALLAAQEKSAVVGSYERAAFAQARWLAADIHQLDRADALAAVLVLEELVHFDAASRLVDDALFRIAWLRGHELGDQAEACRAATRLEQRTPPSTLSACLGVVCPSKAHTTEAGSRCDRALAMARGTPPSL